MFLGDDTLVLLVLALGAAMVVGNGLALIRPPERPRDGDLERAPITRSVVMVIVGFVAVVWSLATLLTS